MSLSSQVVIMPLSWYREQDMSAEKPRIRRVGTWWEYLFFLGKKAALSTAGLVVLILLLLLFAGIVWGAISVSVQWIVSVNKQPFSWDLWLLLLGIGAASSLGLILYQCLEGAFQSLTEMEPVVPLTRHNTGNLPENETLVRASEEPPAHQADV